MQFFRFNTYLNLYICIFLTSFFFTFWYFCFDFRLLHNNNPFAWNAGSTHITIQSLYNYYYHRGMIPIVGKGVVELVSLFFTLWLSVFLFAYLDWHELLTCVDEESCHDSLSDYIIEKVRIFSLEVPVVAKTVPSSIFSCLLLEHEAWFFLLIFIILVFQYINE